MISRNAGANGHAVEATGVLVQLRQYRVQYVGVKPAEGTIRYLRYWISPALNCRGQWILLHDRQHGLREDVLDRTHDVHVHTRTAHPRFQHEIRFRNCRNWSRLDEGCVVEPADRSRKTKSREN